jgi:hypothetical protein
MFHGHLNYFQKPSLGGRPNTKPGDCGTPNAHNRWFVLFYHVRGPVWIEIHWNSIGWESGHIWPHTTLEGPWPHYMILEVSRDDLWTLSFVLSKHHGHGTWLVCEVALSVCTLSVVPLNMIPSFEWCKANKNKRLHDTCWICIGSQRVLGWDFT